MFVVFAHFNVVVSFLYLKCVSSWWTDHSNHNWRARTRNKLLLILSYLVLAYIRTVLCIR